MKSASANRRRIERVGRYQLKQPQRPDLHKPARIFFLRNKERSTLEEFYKTLKSAMKIFGDWDGKSSFRDAVMEQYKKIGEMKDLEKTLQCDLTQIEEDVLEVLNIYKKQKFKIIPANNTIDLIYFRKGLAILK